MTLKQLQSYKHNQREYAAVQQSIDNMRDRLNKVEIISGKVTKSEDEYPFIEQHITVEIQNPAQADPLRDRIIEKESRREYLEHELKAVEDYINSMPVGLERDVLELVYIEGMSQADVGEVIGYTQARVSQIIDEAVRGL